MNISIENYTVPQQTEYDIISISSLLTTNCSLQNKHTTLFGCTKPAHKLSHIVLYNSEEQPSSNPIYIQFANADTLDKAISFSKTYGSIMNPRLVPADNSIVYNYSIVSELKEVRLLIDEPGVIYDCTSYEHFCYYQLQLQSLIQINRILNSKEPTSKENLNLLAEACCKLLDNPYFDLMFALEFADMPYYEDEPTFFAIDPLFRYTHQRLYSKSHDQIDFPDLSLNVLVQNFLERDHTDFYLCHPQALLKLSKYLFSHTLSFTLRNIRPIATNTKPRIEFEWAYNALIDAIFFSFYIDNSDAKKIAICANEYCNNLFTFTGATSRRKYCCAACAHRVASRNSKRRKKAQSASTTSST